MVLRGSGKTPNPSTVTPTAAGRPFIRARFRWSPGRARGISSAAGGASIVSEVSVNGKPAGSHEGAFTAFCYEITPLLKKGSNTISVLVDNTQRNHIAPQRGDFSMFGGLYRPIELIETDGVCIDPLFMLLPAFSSRQSL